MLKNVTYGITTLAEQIKFGNSEIKYFREIKIGSLIM